MVSCLIGTEKHSCLPTDIDVIKWAQRLRELREMMWQLQGPELFSLTGWMFSASLYVPTCT